MNSILINDGTILFAHVLSIHPEFEDVSCEYAIRLEGNGRIILSIYREPDVEATKVAALRYTDWEVWRWDNMARLRKWWRDV